MQPFAHFRGTRDHAVPADRLRAIRAAAAAFREEALDGAPVPFYRTVPLVHVPYPLRYGLRDACPLPFPFVHIVNALYVVQFRDDGGVLRTLLFSPSDVRANEATPFFHRLGAMMNPFGDPVRRLVAPVLTTVETALADIGIRPEHVDWISYDHLHTQDLRKWLAGPSPYFPDARLLVMRREWEAVAGLLPPQRDWYCPGAVDGVPPERVVVLDGDTRLGDGVWLMHTPGHTMGNHSLVARTPEGLMVSSENGICADAYAPARSAIPGLRAWAKRTGMDVVLNGNTLEAALDQYLSMVQEREVAGPSLRNPDFPNVVPSSELASWWGAPGIKPTLRFGPLSFGAPSQRGAS